MQKYRITVAAVVFGLGCILVGANQKSTDKETTGATQVLRHVVLFKFKEGTTPKQVKSVEDGFRALPGKIDAILDFEWGTDVSVENKAAGFTHCFLVTFRNEKGRETYLPHPAHQEFVSLVGPLLDKALVVDYVSSK